MGRFRKFNKGNFTMVEKYKIQDKSEKLQKVLDLIRVWCQDELKFQTESNSVLEKMNNEVTADENICYGRWECAQAILAYMDTTTAKIVYGVGENFEGEKADGSD